MIDAVAKVASLVQYYAATNAAVEEVLSITADPASVVEASVETVFPTVPDSDSDIVVSSEGVVNTTVVPFDGDGDETDETENVDWDL